MMGFLWQDSVLIDHATAYWECIHAIDADPLFAAAATDLDNGRTGAAIIKKNKKKLSVIGFFWYEEGNMEWVSDKFRRSITDSEAEKIAIAAADACEVLIG